MGCDEVGWGRVGVCVCVAKPVAVELRCHATALIITCVQINKSFKFNTQ